MDNPSILVDQTSGDASTAIASKYETLMAYGSSNTPIQRQDLELLLCLSQKRGGMVMLALLRRQLSRLLNIKRLVADYRWRQEKERNRERFAHLMHVGNTVHTEDKSWK